MSHTSKKLELTQSRSFGNVNVRGYPMNEKIVTREPKKFRHDGSLAHFTQNGKSSSLSSRGITKPTHNASSNARPTKLDRTRRQLSNTHQILNPSVRHLSRLESLPTEILEVIFFHTLALSVDRGFLSLPRASLSLGNKLSSDYVRRRLLFYICSKPYSKQLDKNSQTRVKHCEEQVKTQSWILRQSWFTHEFVRHCISDFTVSTLVLELAKRQFHFLDRDAPLVTDETESDIRKLLEEFYDHRSLLLKSARDDDISNERIETCISHKWIESSSKSEKDVDLRISPSRGVIWLGIRERLTLPDVKCDGLFAKLPLDDCWRMMSLNPATQIPSGLLHGPWTLQKIELLEMLIESGASVDWVYTTAGETAERGLHEAILDSNIRAVAALCVSGRKRVPPCGVGVVPTQNHLLIAMDKGCHKGIVEILLNAPKSECGLQDVWVVQGIHEMRKRGWSQRAEWLSQCRIADQQRRNAYVK